MILLVLIPYRVKETEDTAQNPQVTGHVLPCGHASSEHVCGLPVADNELTSHPS